MKAKMLKDTLGSKTGSFTEMFKAGIVYELPLKHPDGGEGLYKVFISEGVAVPYEEKVLPVIENKMDVPLKNKSVPKKKPAKKKKRITKKK